MYLPIVGISTGIDEKLASALLYPIQVLLDDGYYLERLGI